MLFARRHTSAQDSNSPHVRSATILLCEAPPRWRPESGIPALCAVDKCVLHFSARPGRSSRQFCFFVCCATLLHVVRSSWRRRLQGCPRRQFGRCENFYVVKNGFACLSEMSQIVGFLCNTNSQEHDVAPSIHALRQRHDPKHNKSRQFRTHLDQYRNCLFRLFACVSGCTLLIPCWSTKWNGSWQSLSSRDLETLVSDVSSGKSAGAVAKDRGWPRSRRPVATLCRWC